MKKELGTSCTFLSYSREKLKNKEGNLEEKDCLLVYFKNESGGKDKVRIPLNKSFSSLTLDDYNYIFNELRNGERGEATV
jgi:hypothetical protein